MNKRFNIPNLLITAGICTAIALAFSVIFWKPSYFPIEVGKRWAYTIETPAAGILPLTHHVLRTHQFPPSSGELRGVLQPTKGADGKCKLVLRVVEEVHLGPPDLYDQAFELAIDRDDAGIFKPESGRIKAYFGVTQPKSDGLPYGVFLHTEFIPTVGDTVFDSRLIFFISKPRNGFPYEMNRTILYEDEERIDGKKLAHFRQAVAQSRDMPEGFLRQQPAELRHVNLGWTEDTWFERNYGLVKLVQTVGDKQTMIWTLER